VCLHVYLGVSYEIMFDEICECPKTGVIVEWRSTFFVHTGTTLKHVGVFFFITALVETTLAVFSFAPLHPAFFAVLFFTKYSIHTPL